MKRNRLILVLVVFALFLTACKSADSSVVKSAIEMPSVDDYSINLLEWPDNLSIQFEDGVTDREKEVIYFAIEIVRKEFEQYDLDLVGDVYITSNREAYAKKLEDELGYIRELVEYPDGGFGLNSKGMVDSYVAKIFINLDIIRLISVENFGSLKSGGHDTHIMYVVIHEFGHILQNRFSFGWGNRLFVESRSNLIAEKGLTTAFCRRYEELNAQKDPLKLEYVDNCNRNFVMEYLISRGDELYKATDNIVYANGAYFLRNYGYDAFNQFEINLIKCAQENFPDVNTIDKHAEAYKDFIYTCYNSSFEKTFGVTTSELLDSLKKYAKNLK